MRQEGSDPYDKSPAPATSMDAQPRLSRLGLLIWLGLPVVIVMALWFMMDRDRGKPRPDMSGALGPGQRAPTGGESAPKP